MSNRIVQMPPVESFGRLTPDKWLLLKTLEEAAEMVEAGKQYLKPVTRQTRAALAGSSMIMRTVSPASG